MERSTRQLTLLRRTLARESHVLSRDAENLPVHLRNTLWLDERDTDDGRSLMRGAESVLSDRTWLAIVNRPVLPVSRKASAWRLPVAPVEWTPDGRGLVHGGDLLDPRTGARVGSAPPTTGPSSFNHASVVFGGSQGNVVRTLDGAGSAEPAEGGGVFLQVAGGGTVRLDTGASSITSLAWSPGGCDLAVGTLDGELWVWDVGRGSIAQGGSVLWRSNKPILCLAWSPDGERLAAGSWYAEYDVELEFFHGVVRVFDIRSGADVDLGGHWFRVEVVSWSPDGRYLASGAEDGTVRVWRDETCVGSLIGGPGLAWSPDGRLLATSGGGTSIWDVTAFPSPSEAPDPSAYDAMHREGVLDVAWSVDSQLLASGGYQRELYVWDADTGELRASAGGPSSGHVHQLAWSPDGRIAFVTTGYEELAVWDPSNRTEVSVDLPGASDVQSIEWTSDGAVLVRSGGTSRLWRPGTRETTPGPRRDRGRGQARPDAIAWRGDTLSVTADSAEIAHVHCLGAPIDATRDPSGRIRVAVSGGEGGRPIPLTFELRTPVRRS